MNVMAGTRKTIEFNARDIKSIERELLRLEKIRGYPVTLSEALRELVRTHWGPGASAT